MKPENVVFAVTGALFGLIVGWIIGTQQAPLRSAAVAAPAAAQAAQASAPAAAARPMLDEAQVTAMKNVADRDPKNVESRIQLGNLYFDAERYGDAIPWYQAALGLDPKNVNVSTDLGVCYYYTDQAAKAIAQFEQSLSIDPRHVKTFLNMGIVRAFGQQDLKGAAAAWDEVIKLAPGSEEARAAQRALENLNRAHPEGAVAPPTGQAPAGK
jgi:cytochrome c-type biogenesis protein CcmH/NrfG